MILKIKSQKELEQLNTRNLLAYYKAERKRHFAFISSITCGCCGQFFWETNPKTFLKEKEFYDQWNKKWNDYLLFIKSILNKREHVEK